MRNNFTLATLVEKVTLATNLLYHILTKNTENA